MRSKLLILASALLLGMLGCKHGLLRKPCKDDECNAPRPAGDNGGVRLGEPTPGRIPPSNIPLKPDDVPPPNFDAERRYRTQPPPATIPLPSESDARRTARAEQRDGWLEEPIAPNGFRIPGPALPDIVEGDLPPRRTPAPSPAKSTATLLVPFPEKPGVTVGKTPTSAEYETLQKSGTKTMLFVLSDKAEFTETREDAERRGFTVVPLVVTPETLAESSRIFAQALANKKPMHIVEDTGIRVGFLSYVYFRKVEQRSDEVARVLARPLGLPDATTELSKRYWLAARTLLDAP